ncbi:MAG TPA: acetate--CoA ligase [Acidimicrobiia bacterium]|nr:acetate--CoA ligase [Acidimicrobiia bacterium]
MGWEPIRKPVSWPAHREPNLLDYARARESFSWRAVRDELVVPGVGTNIAYCALTRHARSEHAGAVALRWLGKDGTRRELTYGELDAMTNRFARGLQRLGVRPGDRVFTLLGRVPELHVAVLGALKLGAVACPLFSAFGPEPIRERIRLGDGIALVTSASLYRRKVASVRSDLPGLAHVLFVDGHDDAVPGSVDLQALLADSSPEFEIPTTAPEQLALLHFTSGTTGTPKGAMHVHDAVVAHAATARYALDLHPDDVFWCTADPGWVTGTSYGIIAPLVIGATLVVDEAEFDAARWYATLERERVTVWYTAPTAVRMMMRAVGDQPPRATYDLASLRFVASVGEPLNPEAIEWGLGALGLPIHDNWWQTETGGIMIANFAASDIKPGSMGRPLPGIDATILRRDDHGHVVVRDGAAVEVGDPGEEGELALRPGWPSMFRGYLGEEERYRRCFAGGWYLSGDLATRDADGYFWFVGRGDDVIKSAGHLIGPFEVESALMEHPAVAEAGVIGKPDPVVGNVVKAFVVLHPGYAPSDELRLELIGFGRKRLGAAVAPKEIDFRDDLPKTRSGKIMRRLLRARELGLPEGDLSMLETAE